MPPAPSCPPSSWKIAKLTSGACIGLTGDSSQAGSFGLFNSGLFNSGLPPLSWGSGFMGIAVANNNTALADVLSKATLELMAGGDLLKAEGKYMTANGVPVSRELAEASAAAKANGTVPDQVASALEGATAAAEVVNSAAAALRGLGAGVAAAGLLLLWI